MCESSCDFYCDSAEFHYCPMVYIFKGKYCVITIYYCIAIVEYGETRILKRKLDMDNDRYFKPKHRKLDKHFVISVNDRKVKILNYKIYSHWGDLDKQAYQVIEIITKISNQNLNIKELILS